MSTSDKFSFKWNNFKENVFTAFGSLREYDEFSDVTLVCEDGQQVEAHKVILVASSPFFLSLLRKNKHAHPLIYMRGMEFTDLKAILDFIYCGEATIDKIYLDRFLKIGEELKLEGLKEECLNKTVAEPFVNEPGVEKINIQEKERFFNPPFLTDSVNHKSRLENIEVTFQKEELLGDGQEVQVRDNKVTQESKMSIISLRQKEISLTSQVVSSELPEISEWSEALSKENFRGDLQEVKDLDRKVMSSIVQELDQKVRSMMELGQNMLASGRKTFVCKVCGKESQNSSIKDHIETNHIDGIIIPCHFCDKTFSSRASLRRHKFHQH